MDSGLFTREMRFDSSRVKVNLVTFVVDEMKSLHATVQQAWHHQSVVKNTYALFGSLFNTTSIRQTQASNEI